MRSPTWCVAVVNAALLAIVIVCPAPAQDAKKPSRRDLAMIPGDALGFVHLRVAEMWKHPLMDGLRTTIDKAGPKALAQFNKAAYPNPSTLDSLTVVAVAPEPGMGGPIVVGIISFTEPFDKAKLIKTHLPDATPKSIAGKTIQVGKMDGGESVGVYVADDRHVLISDAEMLAQYLSRPIVQRGAMTPAIESAAGPSAVTLAVNVRALPIPPQALGQVPENLQPLTKAERVSLTWDITKPESEIALAIAYANEKAATEAELALKEGLATARAALAMPKQEMEKKLMQPIDGPRPLAEVAELGGAIVGLGGINQMNDYLKNPPIRRVGNQFVMKATIGNEFASVAPITVPVLVGLLLPAVQKVREAAARTQAMNNLKQLALSMHVFHDANGRFPAPAIYDANGKALLSWRVHALPYLEQDALYKQFKLDEPWDSDHNKKLIPLMPKVFASPRVPLKSGETVYKMFTGKAAFGTNPGSRMVEFTDGTSNTAMIVEAGDPVVWTKPEDLPFDRAKPLPKLELPGGLRQLQISLTDGSVRMIDLNRWTEADLKNLIDKADGNIVNWNN